MVVILNILVLFQKVDLLCGVGVKRVCCGTQFTVFLAQDGHVFTCGMDRLIGQPDSRARGHTKPQQVSFMYSRMRWSGHVTHIGKMRNANKIFVGKPVGKRLLRRPGHRWENNIKIDHKEIG
jgi:alpha-tubulin suppressor-like RCC1 family protein